MVSEAITDDFELLDQIEESSAHACNQRLGRYRLCFEVAHGGMATVYLARADGPGGFGKLVALKRIHPHLARERTFVDMFLDEARIASLLSHPNVCGVIDFGEADGTYFHAMEYLVGESLGQVHHKLAQRQRSEPFLDLVPVACRIVADACEGLHSAHELRGPLGNPLDLVHRDVSPHNLFVTFEGSVKVVDFGIARAAGRLHHTQAGAVKGKFPYMAPEMLEGRAIDRRSDVWALGVVLWETIAVKRLFRQQTDSETLLAVMQKPIPRLAEIRADVPPELDRIVQNALARRTEERYATARDLGDELSRFLAARGQAVTMRDVARFMHALFPDGLAKKQQLLQIAMQVDEGVIPSVSQGRDDGASTLSFRSVTASLSQVVQARRRVLPAVVFFVVFVLGALAAAALWNLPQTAPTSSMRAPSRARAPRPSSASGITASGAPALGYGQRPAMMTPAAPPARTPEAVAESPKTSVPAPRVRPPRAPVLSGSVRSAPRARGDRIYRRD